LVSGDVVVTGSAINESVVGTTQVGYCGKVLVAAEPITSGSLGLFWERGGPFDIRTIGAVARNDGLRTSNTIFRAESANGACSGSVFAVALSPAIGDISGSVRGFFLDAEGGAGGADGVGAIEIQEDDIKVADATIINFEGGGGKVIDEGGGKVTVDITPGGDGAPAYYDPDVPPTAPGAYDDEFNDDAIHEDWTKPASNESFNLLQTDDSIHLSESIMHGYLMMQGNFGSPPTFFKAFTPNITQAFTVVVKVEVGIDGATTDSIFLFNVYDDATHWYEVRYQCFGGTLQGRSVYQDGGAAAQGRAIVWPHGTTAYLMITHDGSKNFSSFISADGKAWACVERRRALAGFDSFARLGFGTGGLGATDPIAVVDFVRYFAVEGQYKIGKDV